MCRETGLSVVADVHTHGGIPRQSDADRRHPMIAVTGHIADPRKWGELPPREVARIARGEGALVTPADVSSHMDHLPHKLEKIVSACSSLNRSLEEACNRIEQIGGQLQEAGVAIEVFPIVIDREEGTDGERVTALGYAKLEGKSWGICVGAGLEDVPQSWRNQPIRECSREMQLRVIPHVPELLDLIAQAIGDEERRIAASLPQEGRAPYKGK